MKEELSQNAKKAEWVMMHLRLSGSAISLSRVQCIAAGGYDLTATLEEHQQIMGLLDVLPLMEQLLGLSEELSVPTLHKFYRCVSGGETSDWRKSTPVLFHLSHTPVLPQEIEPELRRLFARLHDGSMRDPVDRAVFVHNEIIRIYPYDRHSETVARVAMTYELRAAGLPVTVLTLREQDYNNALASYMRWGREQAIGEDLRLQLLMQSQTAAQRQPD